MNTHTCANCGNTFLMDHSDVRGCPVCVGGGSMSLSDLLDEGAMTDDAPPTYNDIQTVMKLNTSGIVTIQTPFTTTEWISSDTVAELEP
jgi:hypothetical protein